MGPKDDWTLIQAFNKQYLKIPPVVSEYIAVSEILELCVQGMGNADIAETLEMDEDYVLETIKDFLGFTGYTESLTYSPLFFFGQAGGNYNRFKELMEDFDLPGELNDWKAMHHLCQIFTELDYKIMKHYDEEERNGFAS